VPKSDDSQTITRRPDTRLDSQSDSIASPAAWRRQPPSSLVAEALVGAALAAHKAGALDAWLQRHRRVRRWLADHWFTLLTGAAGDAMRPDNSGARAAEALLHWALAQLRPDRGGETSPIDRAAWLERTSWRPMLALMCQFGLAPVPEFRDRYRPHPDEAAASQLCGLWAVGPSTFYRYLEKGKRALAALLREPPQGAALRLSLREAGRQHAYRALDAALHEAEARHGWHRRQATDALARNDAVAALFHLRHAGDPTAFIEVLGRHGVTLAHDPVTDLLLDALWTDTPRTPDRFALLLALAGLARTRGDAGRELGAYQQALRLATDANDSLRLGIAYGALGKFYEARDPDRAFACYQDSADHLWRSGVADDDAAQQQVIDEFVTTLVKLAWLYVLRNDPRSRAVLDRAEALRAQRDLSAPTVALLEQTWGEYWRRAGDIGRALEHKHRALNLYERLNDRPAVLKTCSNLGLIYGEARDFERAIGYSQRVLALAGTLTVEPEIVASTHLNLGVTYFWQGEYERAAQAYETALAIAQRASLRLLVRRAHYNLAEVCYLRFRQTRAVADEVQGDAHSAAAIAAEPGDPAHQEATRQLKREILGPDEDRAYDRLLPQEFAAHYLEMAEVQRQRAVLAVPVAPETQARAHLAVAQAYLSISVKEREAALALIERHVLGTRFGDELAHLRRTFERELTREQRLATHWGQHAAALLGTERAAAVLAHVLASGTVNKSVYAKLCGLSPATASKHLASLVERGLLAQQGKGPSTRYALPA
jgi:tetratricopeptide (TPR) repeat protein